MMTTTSEIRNKQAQNQLKHHEHLFEPMERELKAPIASVEEFLDLFISDNSDDLDSELENKANKANLGESLEISGSLEDLVKTFDQNVKECLVNYNNIDVGQLAPVQVRKQEDLMNESQIWYTLTGQFGNLFPIDFWSKSLVKKYHHNSLNLKRNKSSKKLNSNDKKSNDLSSDDDEDFDEDGQEGTEHEEDYLSDLDDESKAKHNEKEQDDDDDKEEEEDDVDDEQDLYEFDEDDEELKEQLDMHSLILTRSNYNDSDLSEPLFTAEQVLNEIDTIMTMQEEDGCDDMTPDSGCFSTTNALNSSVCSSNADMPIEMNNSYMKYINTFDLNRDEEFCMDEILPLNQSFIPNKEELSKLNVYELNELIEQIEQVTKSLSDVLVQEFALRDELEFEKETRNTFISLLMSIHDKRRQLNIETNRNSSTSINSKSKNNKRKSMISLNLDSLPNSSYLTTIIPFNSQMGCTVQHLQILNKLLQAINENSQQVPELLTNYILKVVCPT